MNKPSTLKKIETYLVCYEPLPTSGLALLDGEERKEYDHLYAKALQAPREMLPAIEAFRARHRELPEIENLLALVYLYLKQIDKVEALIQESYARFPNYLFARINYADQCLRKKRPERVAPIFEHCFELGELYPDRPFFHVSEFRGFMVLMGLYHLSLNRRGEAERYYHLAKEADPDHLSVRMLGKKIFHVSLLKRIARILRIK